MTTILVIDDDPQMRRVIGRILAQEDHRVVEAADGRQGIAMVEKEHPSVVITDMLMPEKEGVGTILEIRKIAPETKIIAISGGGITSNPVFLDLASRFGADEVLAKPFGSEQLLATVQKVTSAG